MFLTWGCLGLWREKDHRTASQWLHTTHTSCEKDTTEHHLKGYTQHIRHGEKDTTEQHLNSYNTFIMSLASLTLITWLKQCLPDISKVKQLLPPPVLFTWGELLAPASIPGAFCFTPEDYQGTHQKVLWWEETQIISFKIFTYLFSIMCRVS